VRNEAMGKTLVTTDSNYTLNEHAADKNLVQLFEKTVDEYSEQIAFIYQDVRITYRELNKRANQLAHFIQKSGIDAPAHIALYFERNVEMIVSFWAVLKSGHAYIPIETSLKTSLIKNIVNDANVRLIVTMSPFAKNAYKLALKNDATVVVLDEIVDQLEKEAETNLPAFPATNTAYVLYTSGSTGKPKGVQITHLSLVNLMHAMRDEINFLKTDVLLAITPLTFDLSVPDIYLPLITGGRFVLASTHTRFNPNDIIYCISQFHVTVMQATPTTWQMLINNGWKNESQIKIICGGEGFAVKLAKNLKVISEDVWNFYGPTETTVWSTCYKIEEVDETKPVISIGKPIANTQVYIVDEQLQLQAVGVPGELCIGGDGVALGYLNRPESNQRSFITNLFSDDKHSRLYKTGDLAMWDDEGNLHYLGRMDTQIKIRGHRIEASAIENVLLDYEGIKACVVLDKNPEHKHELVAYLILDHNEVSLKDLQDHLKEHFPNYMVPTKYVLVEQFPVSANGKIERKNIPNLPHIRYLTNTIKQTSPLQNKYEEIVVDLIQSFLDREDIDPESNFFDLGLHSMMLVTLTQTLNRVLDQAVSVVDLFDHPTIRSLASFLMRTQYIDYSKESKYASQKQMSDLILKQSFDNDIAVIGLACRVPRAGT
jgi:amino acid adenylation domain-containing protein